ncbi:hypothetical protein BDK51DRAFT_5788, partial [Blyttiomyces helicus]
FGHLAATGLKEMVRHNMVEHLRLELKDIVKIDSCRPCIMGKMTQKRNPKKSKTRATEPLERILTDLCGPFPVRSLCGKYYSMTFIDDES